MRVSYRWLREFLDTDLSPEEIAEKLTMAGLEVGLLERVGTELAPILVGRIRDVTPAPGRERLLLCRVDLGKEVVPIVCAAANISAGDAVPVALPGTVLPGGRVIQESLIHGRTSHGMLCSAEELGFQKGEHDILILPSNAVPGQRVVEALGLDDAIMELDLTPNRPDCLSVMGVAREVAALTGGEMKPLSFTLTEGGEEASDLTSVTIEEPELCPRYVARIIRGVRIGPSPIWMQWRLIAAGVRPISNIVDVTNYVMLEVGHPLHAFDYHRLEEKRIVVRCARDQEELLTLDGNLRMLEKGVLVIADAARAVGLAGIMGGANSEVSSRTEDVLLECAYFNPTSIRKTSKRLGMHTEASHRFERGADPDGPILAIDRAIYLMHRLAGGEVARGRVDEYVKPVPSRRVVIRPERVNRVLGTALSAQEIAAHLERLRLRVGRSGKREMVVDIPTYRVDLEREIDLIEEVARLHGYQNISYSLPYVPASVDKERDLRRFRRMIRDSLINLGFTETIGYSFTSEKALANLGLPLSGDRKGTIRILNPLTPDAELMRPTLLPGLLQTIAANMRRNAFDQRIFEMGRVFIGRGGGDLPDEQLHLAGALAGRKDPSLWDKNREAVNIYDVKGALEQIFELLRLPPRRYVPSLNPSFHPALSMCIDADGHLLGQGGEVHPEVALAFDIPRPVLAFEINLDLALSLMQGEALFKGLPKFPSTTRDIAIIVDREIEAGEILNAIKEAGISCLVDVALFDVYTGDPIPADKKSLAFSLTYRSDERTLTDEEVNRIHSAVPSLLGERFGAAIR